MRAILGSAPIQVNHLPLKSSGGGQERLSFRPGQRFAFVAKVVDENASGSALLPFFVDM